MTLTRRDATKLVLAGSALAAAPLPALAKSNQEWGLRLQEALNAALQPGRDGRFAVTGFGQGRDSAGNHIFITEVELYWPPGFRKRPYRASAGTEDDTFDALFQMARDAALEAWPGCMV